MKTIRLLSLSLVVFLLSGCVVFWKSTAFTEDSQNAYFKVTMNAAGTAMGHSGSKTGKEKSEILMILRGHKDIYKDKDVSIVEDGMDHGFYGTVKVDRTKKRLIIDPESPIETLSGTYSFSGSSLINPFTGH